MIIDLILDRQDGTEYIPSIFYNDVREYENIFNLGSHISLALDYGTEADVKRALCGYIDSNNYNPEIKNFINNVDWLN